MMNVGICIRHAEGNVSQHIRDAADQGFAHAQLVSWQPELWNPDEAGVIRKALKECGVTLTAFWCGWTGPKAWNFVQGPETLGLVPPAYRWARMQELIRGADFALTLSLTDVISHMGFIPETPTASEYAGFVDGMRFVAQHLKQQGQNLLFETGQETPVTMIRCFEDIGLDNLYVNLDPANLILYGKANPVDALDVFGKLVRGVHAKDGLYPTNGRQLGREVKVGEGKSDFPKLIRALRDLGYDGSLTIEREISGPQQVKDILATRAYLNGLIRALET